MRCAGPFAALSEQCTKTLLLRLPALLSAVLVAVSCSSEPDAGRGSLPPSLASSPYAFHEPDAEVQLSDKLKEISGIEYIGDSLLAAIQDEDGDIFVLNLHTGEQHNRFAFDDDGDYEDLERVGDRMFVLRSDGTLFEVEAWDTDDPKVEKHKTDLKSKHDTEGLVYDEANNRLLIVCKEDPGVDRKHVRAIYAYDFEEKDVGKEPLILIDLEAIERELTELRRSPLEKTRDLLAADGRDGDGFKPSAAALHPATGELYVLSSVLRAMAVLTPEGVVKEVYPLAAALFPQPEGIAFMPDGTLLISNEGRQGPATLLRFSYRPID